MIEETGTRERCKRSAFRLAIWAGVPFAILAGSLTVLATHWPFTRSKLVEAIKGASGAEVRIGRFHQTFFPHPGCVAEEVELLQSGSGKLPVLTSVSLTVWDSWPNRLAFRQRIDHITIKTLHIYIRREKPFAPSSDQNELTVGELIADGAILDIERDDGNRTLRFAFPQLKLHEVGRNSAIGFSTTLNNPSLLELLRRTGSSGLGRTAMED